MKDITELIIGSAYEVANVLGSGFVEKVYENALVYELTANGLQAEQQKKIEVFYKEKNVGDYYADILVNEDIILELKAVKSIELIHIAQCLHYLKGTGKKLGLIINFGTPRIQIRRIVND
jgi:GxxExxY protein